MSDSNGNGIEKQEQETEQEQEAQTLKKKRAKTALTVVIVMCVIIVVSCIGFFVYTLIYQQMVADRQAQTEVPGAVEDGPELPANPIDFATLQAQNPEIYGWIYIPNTYVNLPILQSGTDDLYYMTHNQYGEVAAEGAVFSQSANKKDFSDPVTVLYGHNMISNGMFASLHFFEDADFFNNNDTCYVYIPGKILTYQVIAAYQYDDRHILNSFDFSNISTRTSYFASILAPTSLVQNVRAGATLTADDKILQLSTCVSGTFSTQRYIVTCKLVNTQDTK